MKLTRIPALVALGLFLVGSINVSAAEGPESLVGKQAPAFTLSTPDGKEVKLADLKDNVVVLDFWATWCPPCRESLPHLDKIAANEELAKKGLKVYAVNLREDKAKIQNFMKQNEYTFPVLMDKDASVAKEYLVRGIPTTIIIGRDGKVAQAFVGFGPGSAERLDKAIEATVEKK